MDFLQKFTFRMKSEPVKQAFKWTVSEDKVIWLQDNRKLRKACRRMKAEGLRTHRFSLIRDWFMVELGLLTGLRVMEVQNLRIGDLFLRSNMSSVHVRNGKGGKRRDVYINTELKHECMEFLQIRRKFGLPDGYNDFVFCSTTGRPVTTRCLQKAFKRCLVRAGINWNYTFHCMRHTYATFLLELSNLRVVQDQLGHSSVKTTEIYTSLIKKSLKKTLDKIYR
jgi:site-specific recombinase XerD